MLAVSDAVKIMGSYQKEGLPLLLLDNNQERKTTVDYHHPSSGLLACIRHRQAQAIRISRIDKVGFSVRLLK